MGGSRGVAPRTRAPCLLCSAALRVARATAPNAPLPLCETASVAACSAEALSHRRAVRRRARTAISPYQGRPPSANPTLSPSPSRHSAARTLPRLRSATKARPLLLREPRLSLEMSVSGIWLVPIRCGGPLSSKPSQQSSLTPYTPQEGTALLLGPPPAVLSAPPSPSSPAQTAGRRMPDKESASPCSDPNRCNICACSTAANSSRWWHTLPTAGSKQASGCARLPG